MTGRRRIERRGDAAPDRMGRRRNRDRQKLRRQIGRGAGEAMRSTGRCMRARCRKRPGGASSGDGEQRQRRDRRDELARQFLRREHGDGSGGDDQQEQKVRQLHGGHRTDASLTTHEELRRSRRRATRRKRPQRGVEARDRNDAVHRCAVVDDADRQFGLVSPTVRARSEAAAGSARAAPVGRTEAENVRLPCPLAIVTCGAADGGYGVTTTRMVSNPFRRSEASNPRRRCRIAAGRRRE